MQSIVLPTDFTVSRHAAERFLERIILKQSYSDVDVEMARDIINNILSQRILKYYEIDQHIKQVKYLNAIFIYDIDENSIITVYENKYEISRDKVGWIYKLPNNMRFKKGITSAEKVQLIIKGIIPVGRDGRVIIGQNNAKLYCYDPYYKVIKTYEVGQE